MPSTVHTLRLELRVLPGLDDRATGSSASAGPRAWAAHTPDGERLGVLELAPRYEDDRPDAPAWWYGPVLRDGAWGSDREGGRREDALLHEAAIATVEALLDAEGWATPLRMREGTCGALHPSKLGYQRRAAADPAGPGARWWSFDPDQDALRADAIVVAVSGGGLRATGFALGAFAALHQAGALARVRAVTSVSGGSIFTGAWLAGAARGLDFPTTAARLRAFLVGDDEPDPPRAPTWLDFAPGTFRYDASWRPLSADPRERDAATQPAPTLTRRLADFLAAGLLAGPNDATLRLGDGARGAGPSPDGGAPTGGAPAAWPAEVVFQSTELTRGGSFVLAATPEGRVQQGISPRLRLPPSASRTPSGATRGPTRAPRRSCSSTAGCSTTRASAPG